MPLKFNPEACVFIPTAPTAPPAGEGLQLRTDEDALSSPATTPAAPPPEDQGTCAPPPAQPSQAAHGLAARSPLRRPGLPRITSGLELDAQELDFDDLLMSSPLAHGRGGDSGSQPPSPAEGDRPEVLWTPEADGGEAGGSEGAAPVEMSGSSEEEEEGAAGGGGGGSSDDGRASAAGTPARPPSADCGGEASPKVGLDSFEIMCLIGQGGFGKVYHVKRKGTGRCYAMKCMRKDCVFRDNLKGTKAERAILGNIAHPYIVNMHWAFQCRSRLYIVMDYFPGGQFLDMLQHHSPFDPEACVLYTGEIVLALQELHERGIVHRDLKPENILVDSGGHLCVTDFGCSKVSEGEGGGGGGVRTKSWAGTELYMAPEQLQQREYGAEVDWWALGALAWEMATGDHPFYSNNRKTIVNNILKKKLALPSYLPAASHSLLKGLLCRDPAKRLGYAGGAAEIKAHPFFKKLSWQKLLARELPAPLRSHALEGDEFDTSAHSARYTGAGRELSPIASPNILSASKQEHFEGFSWTNQAHRPPPPEAGGLAGSAGSGASGASGEGWAARGEGGRGEEASGGSTLSSNDAPEDGEGEGGRMRTSSVSIPIPVGAGSAASARPLAIRGF